MHQEELDGEPGTKSNQEMLTVGARPSLHPLGMNWATINGLVKQHSLNKWGLCFSHSKKLEGRSQMIASKMTYLLGFPSALHSSLVCCLLATRWLL